MGVRTHRVTECITLGVFLIVLFCFVFIGTIRLRTGRDTVSKKENDSSLRHQQVANLKMFLCANCEVKKILLSFTCSTTSVRPILASRALLLLLPYVSMKLIEN